MAIEVPVTPWQADEVGGLLDVYDDEGWTPFAILRR